MTDLQSLIERVENATGPSSELDIAIYEALFGLPIVLLPNTEKLPPNSASSEGTYVYMTERVPRYTSFLDAARSLVREVLPGFFMTSGLCYLSSHASIGPDYNGPHGERLRREWPPEKFHQGFDADLTPGDSPHRECLAVIHCVLRALLARSLHHETEG